MKAALPTPSAPERSSGYLHSKIECTANAVGRANANLDCDDPVRPNNEPHIAVDPTDPLHMVASSNDYDGNGDQFYTTFDGGQTWTTGDMSMEGMARTGSDPVTAFDPKHGTVLHSSLNYRTTREGLLADGDAVVSISTDGGVRWGKPVVVAAGVGDDGSRREIFADKPWIVADTNPASPYYGRAYLVWSSFHQSFGSYRSSPILEAHSDDGGYTWTPPQAISGSSSAFCTFQTAGEPNRCDEDQAASAAVAPDGTVAVAFESAQNQAAWEAHDRFENSYLVVHSNYGGQTWSAPIDAVDLEDGSRDYPTNGQGYPTLSGLQLRVWSVGNLAAGPLDGKLYLVFSDDRAGAHDVRKPVTDSNVYLVTSSDGEDWSAPIDVATGRSDQWFPSVAVSPVDGTTLSVLYNGRDPQHPNLYEVHVATGTPGSFSKTVVSTKPSHPTKSLFFRALVSGCSHCAEFAGDYIWVAYGSDGKREMVWTDMRRFEVDRAHVGFTENIFFARR